MRKVFVFLAVVALSVSCRMNKPREAVLSPTGTAALFVYPPSLPTMTLFWTNRPMSNVVVNVRESSDPFSNPENWPTIASVSETYAVTLPMLPSRNFFWASIVAQTMTLAWDYPTDQISPELSFNLYWQPDGATQWTFLTNVPPDNLMAQLQITAPSGRFALTATNSALQAESDFSNIVPWTSRVGQPVQLQIKLP